MSLTGKLVRLIRAKPVVEADLRAAALYFLDAAANAIAGRKSPPGRVLSAWASTAGQDAGREALYLGGLIHTLETDDLHRASVVHPGCVVVPAVIALGKRTGAGGREALSATLQGFEACCRVGMAVGPGHYKIWHNTATCGPFGSAMAAAGLLGLDDEQATHALGNAGTQAAGLWQFLETGAMSKHLHAGRAAEAGVVAAELARFGFTGAPAILEGEKGFFAGACPDPQPDAVTRDAEARWQLHETSIKPWPSCRHTHPVIDAALEVHEQLQGREIDTVTIDTYQAAVDVCDRPSPQSEYEAKFSLYHTAAVALSDGEVTFSSFDAEARERLAGLRSRVRARSAEPFSSNYPKSWGARIEVVLSDGSRINAERLNCKGDPEMMLDADEMKAKARVLLAFGGMDEAAATHLINGILAMADDGPMPELFVT
ncbi:MAG: MmgE/PrpD family protein [Rhodospirillales bacterium]|jgi:2-methylcitrate dehydratase PrpD|nr:MmgE/PrpD family protein [Rhodospirillales bacterium]